MSSKTSTKERIKEQAVSARPWPADGLNCVLKCPCCESPSRSILHQRLVDRVFLCAPGEWTLYSCEDCGSAYLDPQPSRATLPIAYRQYYTHIEAISTTVDAQIGYGRLVRKALANGYRNWKYNAKLSPSWKFGAALGVLVPWLRENLDREFRYIPRDCDGKRLLDIGCGDGSFLSKVSELGWHVAGVEPDEVAASIACKRGLDVWCGDIENYDNHENYFDVVTISHVIEHVYDPDALLQSAYALLKPGGLLFVETPNIDSYGHIRFGEYWLHLDSPRHLMLFNWDSLYFLLQQSGFSNIQLHPAANLFPGSAAYSRALRSGLKIEDSAGPYTLDILLGWWVKAKLIFNIHLSEYITLTAQKPNGN